MSLSEAIRHDLERASEKYGASKFGTAFRNGNETCEDNDTCKNVSWGKEKAYREGKVQFQYKYLLGYKKGDDGKPEIVPEEAEIVRLIYKLFLDGYSMTRIKKLLEDKKYLTAQGKKVWNESLIRSILKNEKYVGDALLQKTFTSDCITHKIVKNHGERPMYLVTNHHEPIVDRDTYNRVQQELARRTRCESYTIKDEMEVNLMNEKLMINAALLRKESEFRTKSCVVEKVMAVSHDEFDNLKRHPLRDNDLITEHSEMMFCDSDGNYHCLLSLQGLH